MATIEVESPLGYLLLLVCLYHLELILRPSATAATSSLPKLEWSLISGNFVQGKLTECDVLENNTTDLSAPKPSQKHPTAKGNDVEVKDTEDFSSGQSIDQAAASSSLLDRLREPWKTAFERF